MKVILTESVEKLGQAGETEPATAQAHQYGALAVEIESARPL